MKVVWYDGGKRPPRDLFGNVNPENSGSLIVGDKGKLYSPGDYGDNWKLLGGVSEPKVNFPNSPGHFEEWVQAIQGGKTPMSNFPDYAGPLTETMLLGNLAVWVAASGKGEKVEWDAKELKVKNITGLEPIVRRPYREGYSLDEGRSVLIFAAAGHLPPRGLFPGGHAARPGRSQPKCQGIIHVHFRPVPVLREWCQPSS